VVQVLTDDSVLGRQQIVVPQSDGPSLVIVSGLVLASAAASSPAGAAASYKETYRLLVGPTLTGPSRAIASASIANVFLLAAGQWSIGDIEADFDDESGRMELRFELSISIYPEAGATLPRSIHIEAVEFTVTIVGTPA
jgi:hypothetical protein